MQEILWVQRQKKFNKEKFMQQVKEISRGEKP